jgi:hypothetical protein
MTDDDFSDLVEECNSPAAKRIEQLERELAEARHHIEKYAAEARSAIEAHEDACGKLADALSIIDQIRKGVIADESFGQFIQTLFLDPLGAKERELAEVQELLCQTSAEREHNGRMANECRMQRDRLVEALQAFMRWADSVDVPNEVQRMCHKALAAVKGGEP